MIISDRSFPHPVLAPFRDDVSPNVFSLKLMTRPDADNYYLDLQFIYEHAQLGALIESGQAVHAVHFECRRNFFREIRYFRDKAARIAIPAAELVGRVEISGFIIAQAMIADYRISGAHPDYGDTAFRIGAGDILAAAPTMFFDAYVDYDPLKQISSILTIRKSENIEEGPMMLNTEEDRIVVTLSRSDYSRYTELKGDPAIGPLLANQVVIPALQEAMHEMKADDEGEFELDLSKRWFRSVHRKLEEQGIDIRSTETSVIEAVQSLLKLPLRRSLEGLIQMNPLDEKP